MRQTTKHLMATALCCTGLLAGCASQPTPDLCNPVVVDFYRQIRVAITDASAQAQVLEKSGTHGMVAIGFNYSGGGKATNVHITGRSSDDRVQQAGLDAVRNATFPPKPVELKDIDQFEVDIAIGAKGYDKLIMGTITSGVQVATMTRGSGNSQNGATGLSPGPVSPQCTR